MSKHTSKCAIHLDQELSRLSWTRGSRAFRIDQLDPDLLAGKDAAVARNYNVISHQEMPPQDDPEYAMSEESRSHIIEWLW